MILVLLGTQDKSFSRLLKAVEYQMEIGTIKEEVIVQAGYTKYESDKMKIFDFISKEELSDYVEKSSFIITHAGVGSILDGIRHGKKMIVAARLKKYKEHTNDHQLQILKEFADLGYILPLYDFSKLKKLLRKVDTFEPKPFLGNHKIPELIESFIETNVKEK